MRVLLVYPAYGKKLDRFPSRPPLGLAYLAAYARRAGYECQLLDEPASKQGLAQALKEFQPQVVGFSVTTWAAKAVLEKAALVKREYPHVVCVAGGPHATAIPEHMLNGGIDVVVRGYGEKTFIQVLEALARQGSLGPIAGISFNAGGEIVHNSSRDDALDLNTLPNPDYDGLDLTSYRWCSISSSRGCPMSCAFCADSHLFGKKLRFRTPENFVGELERMYFDHGTRKFYFVDEQFTFDEQRAIDICQLIVRKGLDIAWLVNSRVDRVSLDLLTNMRKAGCRSVAFGVESGSEQILKTIRKGITPQQVERAVSLTRQAGIRVKTSWIVGLPGDMTEQLKSVSLMEKTQPNHIDVYWLTLYPGTPFWNDPARYGIYFDPADVPLTATDKLNSTSYGYTFMSKAQVIQVAEIINERMLNLGYRIAGLEENDYDPNSKVLASFLRYLNSASFSHELLK